ncbi:NAD(P)-binding protein [Mycobacterium paraffinicum]|uniref:Monooxygenase n=1 Tax=Mycobacterium paraffinicum TaxID=53378 RepID=A0ABP8RBR3_9MYCO
MENTAKDCFEIIVIGAGFSGIGMGIKLLQAGFSDFLIVDDADEVGGTSNRYYFDKHGEVPLRPTTTRESSWRSHSFDLGDYSFERRTNEKLAGLS